MAITDYESSYKRYFGDRFENISHNSTDEDVKQLYEGWAPEYDQDNAKAGSNFRKPLAECLDAALVKLLPSTPKDELKIIDAGAGTGMVCIELQKRGYTNVHALDISQAMLNEAKKKNVPYKRFICAPLTEKRIPEIETGEFDALISASVLLKAHVRPSAFVEMIRMVKTGGLLCFNLRCNEEEEYKPKMMELEKVGMWENICRKTISYFENDDLPSDALGFLYKVLRK